MRGGGGGGGGERQDGYGRRRSVAETNKKGPHTRACACVRALCAHMFYLVPYVPRYVSLERHLSFYFFLFCLVFLFPFICFLRPPFLYLLPPPALDYPRPHPPSTTIHTFARLPACLSCPPPRGVLPLHLAPSPLSPRPTPARPRPSHVRLPRAARAAWAGRGGLEKLLAPPLYFPALPCLLTHAEL